MAWGKVDDKLWGSPKWLATPLRARGLWCSALSYSMDQLTDGVIPSHVVPILGGRLSDARALVDASLWEASAVGFKFHDWEDYQPSRESIMDKRDAAAARKADWRAKKAGQRAKADAQNEDVPDMSQGDMRVRPALVSDVFPTCPALPDPTRPDPTPTTKEITTVAAVAAPRDDVERICLYLADRVEANGSKRPEINKTARQSARLMLDVDKRTEDQVVWLIDWCQGDDFWRGNVLSVSGLRSKFDQLRLASQRTARTPDRQADLLRSEMVKAREADARNEQRQNQIGAA